MMSTDYELRIDNNILYFQAFKTYLILIDLKTMKLKQIYGCLPQNYNFDEFNISGSNIYFVSNTYISTMNPAFIKKLIVKRKLD